ncbi:MAG: hypothetical protein GY761_02665 [Hyphomicrobiales bacterium]|nr:hypothetical protein [Hyphomicrobiales bacterium]
MAQVKWIRGDLQNKYVVMCVASGRGDIYAERVWGAKVTNGSFNMV